jgi:hypothetical protein
MEKDVKALEVLSLCNDYAESKVALSNSLRDAFFQLAMAAKSGQRYTVEDCRQDIDADVRVNSTESGAYELSCDSESGRVTTVFGLPHRNLRLAQARFLDALKVRIVDLCIRASHLIF